MKLATAKKRFHGNWLAFRFTDESKGEGKLLFHEKERHKLFQKLASKKRAKIYVTYAGPMLPKEYSVILTVRL